MNKATKFLTLAAIGATAIGMVTISADKAKAAKGDKEKCYGVVKAGANDCGNSAHSCAGQAPKDNADDEWLYLPKGVCERLAGGSTSEK